MTAVSERKGAMRQLTLNAPAKINLALDILRRRPDGYHELRTVMQAVSLCDTVTVRTADGDGELTVRSSFPELTGGPDNLAYQAARVFFDAVGTIRDDVDIFLEKRIPVCAGLAGGSTDAAAVLRALRELVRPELGEEKLEELGAAVGSDVPFCLRGGTALAEGRGEVLTPLPGLPDCRIVLCKPDFGVSTRELFGRVRLSELTRRPDTEGMCRALARGSLSGVAETLCNVFEEALDPEKRKTVASIAETMRRNGALNAAMTGSGPTVFGLFQREDAAREAAMALKERYSQVFFAKPL
jgi:4-diphosphocytidyl-2-C-methyl-D-erythritol kinase